MIRKLVATLVLAPLAILLTAFAVANRHKVLVSFDPFDPADPAFTLEPPLYVLILVMVIAGVILGGTVTWTGQGKWRSRVRRLEAEARKLRQENERLQRRASDGAPAPLPLVDAPRLTMPPR
jgi:uncharacterized integral membrane protein